MSDLPEQTPEPTPPASVALQPIAGALVGGTDQTVRLWFQDPGASLVALTEDVLETVDALWLPASRTGR